MHIEIHAVHIYVQYEMYLGKNTLCIMINKCTSVNVKLNRGLEPDKSKYTICK